MQFCQLLANYRHTTAFCTVSNAIFMHQWDIKAYVLINSMCCEGNYIWILRLLLNLFNVLQLWSLIGGLPVYLHILLEDIENILCRLDWCPKSLIHYSPSCQITLSLSHIRFQSVSSDPILLGSIEPSKVLVESTMIWELDGGVWFHRCFHLFSHFPHQCVVVKSRKVSEI